MRRGKRGLREQMEIVDNVESVDEPVNMTQNQGRRK